MAKYNLVDEVEAHELGVKPEPAWLDELRRDGSIKDNGNGTFKIGAPYGWADASLGDYLLYDAAVYTTVMPEGDGEPTDVLVTPKRIDVMSKADFEQTYQLVQGEHPSDADHA